jgi:hypothetical protein
MRQQQAEIFGHDVKVPTATADIQATLWEVDDVEE